MFIKFLIFLIALLLNSCMEDANDDLIKKQQTEKLSSLEKDIYFLKKRVEKLETASVSNVKEKDNKSVISRDVTYALDDGFFDDPFIGSSNPSKLIVVYSDMKCTQCRKFLSTTFTELFKRFTDSPTVQLRFRDYPLSKTPLSKNMAMAAHCAGEQGSYWDFLFSIIKIEDISDDSIEETLRKIPNLELDRIKSCIKSNKYKREISIDKKHAKNIGILGTPGIFLGSKSNQKEFKGIIIRGNQPLGLVLKELKLIN